MYVNIAGREVEADKLVCSVCNALDMDTDIDTTDPVVWVATCSAEHSWAFVP
jgi:hypothetical protein